MPLDFTPDHFFVFGINLESENDKLKAYSSEINPLSNQNDSEGSGSLHELAKILVDRQLDRIRACDLDGDEYFPLSFNFTPPYDVKMQRQRIWHTRPLTIKERQEFLVEVKKHYLAQCDPITRELEDSENCTFY